MRCILEKVNEHTFHILKQNVDIGFAKIELKDEEAIIQLHIQDEYQRQGYGTDTLKQLLDYGHHTLGIHYLHAYVDFDDDLARHLVEHCGFERVTEVNNQYLYAHHEQETLKDDGYVVESGKKVLYLAGGCFWGMEKALRILDCVTETKTGYANGYTEHPTYEEVCHNENGFRETVRVTFDAQGLDTILKAYFLCINPEQKDGQGGDIGEQYLTGIYYRDISMEEEIHTFVENERKKYENFYVECKPLENFWEAEEYHQDYLSKIPSGYCHISTKEFALLQELNESRKNDGK